MKVLLLTDQMDMGGAETHLYHLCLGLRRMGVDVTLLSEGGRLADALERMGIAQIRLSLRTKNPFRLLRLRQKLRRILQNGGFSIAHAHARIPAFLLRGLSSKACAVTVTAHAKFKATFPYRHLSHWGDRTVAVSEDLRLYLAHTYRLPPERITVIPNGIDCDHFSPPRADSRHSHAQTAPHVLFASRMDADCSLGAELLCRIAPSLLASFPQIRITLTGGGSEYERIRALSAHVNRVLGKDVIRACGRVDDMAALMRESTVFVGVSRAAMEAAACGCAVLLCGNEGYLGILNASSFPRAMRSNFCAREEDPPTAIGLLADIKELLRHPEKRLEYATVVRALLLSHCSAEQMCRATLRLYQRICPVPARVTLTVGGYFGCGNLGDDAILLGLLEELRLLAPDVRVRALTGNPTLDRKRFGILCFSRTSLFSVRRALKQCDGFLCGGGSLLQNITSHRSLLYYLSLLRFSQSCCPTVLYACGIGPLLGETAGRQCKHTLNRCSYISLRDESSLLLLQRLGVRAELLHLGADAALFLPPPPKGREFAILHRYRQAMGQKYLAVILRDMKADSFLFRILSGSIRTVCQQFGWTPLFLCMDQKHDRAITRLAAQRLGGIAIEAEEASDVTALLRASEVAISLRLHGMILASTVGTPTLGISVDEREQKLSSFAKRTCLPILSQNELTVAATVEALETLVTSAPQMRVLIRESLAEQRKNARKDLENILQMLYNKDRTVSSGEMEAP